MGDGRMASAPPVEGADPAAMTDRWAYTGHRQARTAQIYTSRSCSGSAAELRDQRLLSTDGLRLHIFTLLSLRRVRRPRTIAVCVSPAGGTSDSCPSLLALGGIGNDVAPKGPGDTLRSIVRTGYVPPTPFTHYGRGSFFSSGVRAGLPPLSPDASCSVAVSLSPWGATRLGGGYCPHPPAHLQGAVLQDLSASLCEALSLCLFPAFSHHCLGWPSLACSC